MTDLTRELVDAVGDLEQAVRQVEPGLAPQARVGGFGGRPFEESVGVEIPDDTTIGGGDLPVDIQIYEFDKTMVFHWVNSSPNCSRKLSRARAMRLLTVPTLMPRISAISS